MHVCLPSEPAVLRFHHIPTTEQIIDLRLTLRYLGVPINGRSIRFRIDHLLSTCCCVHPQPKMHKRWVALSYHRVRWAVAAGIINICHIAGKKNPADILSKHWNLPSVWDTMKPLLFWHWKSDEEVLEEPEDVNKDTVVDKAAPDEAATIDVKTTSLTKGDSKESQPHRGEC